MWPCCLCLQAKLSLTLKEYRLLHGAHVRNPGALIYPSTLRYMPAYLLGLVKSTAFRCAQQGLSRQTSSLCACVRCSRHHLYSPPRATSSAEQLLYQAWLLHPYTQSVVSNREELFPTCPLRLLLLLPWLLMLLLQGHWA